MGENSVKRAAITPIGPARQPTWEGGHHQPRPLGDIMHRIIILAIIATTLMAQADQQTPLDYMPQALVGEHVVLESSGHHWVAFEVQSTRIVPGSGAPNPFRSIMYGSDNGNGSAY